MSSYTRFGEEEMHTPRRVDESRPHIQCYARGTKFSFRTTVGLAYGVVDDVDEGGWIYPAWVQIPDGSANLPGWFRSTQVCKLSEFPEGVHNPYDGEDDD